MSPARNSADRTKLATLIVEALDRIATPDARFEVLDRALLLARSDSLPTEPQALWAFVDGPLHAAVLAILGRDAAELLLEQLGVLIARSGIPQSSDAPAPSGPQTLPPPAHRRATSDVVPCATRPGAGAHARPVALTESTPKAPRAAPRHSTLTYQSNALLFGDSERQRVLVVDDDEHYRRALSRLLDAHGYDVNAAPNGKTALWMIEKLRPDLVVTDYELGDTDGVTLADEIKQRLGEQAPPVILVTASAALPKATGSIARILVKSVSDTTLVDAAAELLAKPAEG
jgi:CheY-like chemotaxis protein